MRNLISLCHDLVQFFHTIHWNTSIYLLSLCYYGAWFLCVGLAAQGWPWMAMCSHLVFGLLILLHIKPRLRKIILYYAWGAAVLGWVIDHMLWWSEVLIFPAHTLCWGMTPLWMSSLWFTLMILLLGPFQRVIKHKFSAILLGSIGGPLSYISGSHSSAMGLGVSHIYVAFILAMIWGMIMYLMYELKESLARSHEIAS